MATDQETLGWISGRTRVIDERQYLSFADYLKWRGRRAKGDLKSAMRTGLVVSTWNQLVEEHGCEGAAFLAGTEVAKLSCYLDGYRYRRLSGCRGVGGRSKPT